MTPDEIAALRDKHKARPIFDRNCPHCLAASTLCVVCETHWPCDTVRLLDELERLREALTEAVRGKVVNNWLTAGEDVCLVCGELPNGIHDENCWVPKAVVALAEPTE